MAGGMVNIKKRTQIYLTKSQFKSAKHGPEKSGFDIQQLESKNKSKTNNITG